ncbi:MAG TPA: LolA-related protein [Nitrospira sp.]|jgi:outer membrane lipoprotein-sorting protein|nr:LolA-related protein [Nitrospira sp.]
MTWSTTLTQLILLSSLFVELPAAAQQAAAPQPLDVPGLMELMAKVSAREDRFTETKTLSMLTQPLVLHGTLAYVRPDRVEKHTTSPYAEHLIVRGDQLTLSNKEGTKRIAVDSHPLIRSFIEAIRASLAGEVAVLRRLYHIKLQGTQQNWTLILRPLDVRAAEYLTSITLTGHGDRLTAVDIREAGGDRSLMQIHEPVS